MKKYLFAMALAASSVIAACAWAQEYRISTIAGGSPPATPIAAYNSPIGSPVATATDNSGNLYFVSLNCVFKVNQNLVLTVVAGNSTAGYSGDGGPALSAQLNGPTAIALDKAGNLYIADAGNYRVRRVSSTGVIATVAGNGAQGHTGDNGPAVNAQLNGLAGIAVDSHGSLYISDRIGSWIREVSTAGIITTIAGTGSNGYSGDNVPAAGAQLYNPCGLAVDGADNLYIADSNNFRIREISNGTITTVAGSGGEGFAGDGQFATQALLNGLFGLAVDSNGNIFFADTYNVRIREVLTTGIITTVAGSGSLGFAGDGLPALVSTMNTPLAVAVDGSGNVFVADRDNHRIRKVAGGKMGTVAGNGTSSYSGDSGPAMGAQLSQPLGVAVDGSGNIYISDYGNSVIRMVSPAGVVTTIAGTGVPGSGGDGGQANGAQLTSPWGIALDAAGNLYIADGSASVIRKVSPGGIITTVAGGGSANPGDGGPATSAALIIPQGVSVDPAGNIFIAETGSARIRRVSAADGTISTVAGNGSLGYTGDGGPATSATLNSPYSVLVDAIDNIYIADTGNNVIRRVSGGNITTIAGNGIAGFSGDGGQGVNAQLNAPYALAEDNTNTLYIADYGNSRVRKLLTDDTISTVSGAGTSAYSGDGGPASTAQLHTLTSVAVDSIGDIYVVDSGNGLVRKMVKTFQLIMTGAVVDAASESAGPVSPGQIMVIYGAGLGPAALVQNQPVNGFFGTQVGGTQVFFNGLPAPMIYTSATQVAAIVPYNVTFSGNAQVAVSYQGQVSTALTLPVAASAPALFTTNQTGSGQVALLNADGTPNDAAHPAPIGSYIAMFATGEGQTNPAGVDGKLANTLPYPAPLLPVKVFVGGIQATNVAYAATAPTEVAGLFQVNIQIPPGVQPGGYVPIVLQVGNNSTVNGAVWMAVSPN
jgi:trimeric autotransporter adhesin